MGLDSQHSLASLRAEIDSGKSLALSQIQRAAEALISDQVSDEDKECFLIALAEKGESPQDIASFAKAFLPKAVDPGMLHSYHQKALFDCCGTGGGGLNLINVSTALMFILAAAEVPVVKHGNRGLTKKSGSADVLTALGVKNDCQPDQARAMLDEVGCTFYLAPLYHPSFKVVAPVRQKLGKEGKRTLFNYLGPLLNPTQPAAQMVGLFKEEQLGFYAKCLQELGRKRYLVIYGESADRRPLGEASCLGRTRLLGQLDDEEIDLTIAALGEGDLDDLLITGAEDSAKRLCDLFYGRSHDELLLEILSLNAGIALWVQGASQTYEAGMDRAKELILSGKVGEKLKQVIQFSDQLDSA
ncbi:MAG: anthranilate phosphoribosyltransferase [Verrucomicrobiota bacterium]